MGSLIPSAIVWLSGYWERLLWSERITLIMVTLAVGVNLVAAGIYIWEKSSNFFTTRREQKRIAIELGGLAADGVKELDTASIAALWAGTRADEDITRHMRFRRIKSAIDNNQVKNAIYKNGKPPANIHTWVPIDDLKEYFLRVGIIVQKDWDNVSR